MVLSTSIGSVAPSPPGTPGGVVGAASITEKSVKLTLSKADTYEKGSPRSVALELKSSKKSSAVTANS